jgi:geranyl diphosphate synthase
VQYVDDILDFTGSSNQLGKPALNDLKSGLATAPVLFAAEEHPQLLPMILRKFKGYSDVTTAQRLVQDSQGIARTREMAASHAALAAEAVRRRLPPHDYGSRPRKMFRERMVPYSFSHVARS